MTDVLTADQRHLCMSRIRDRDTHPERMVRSIIHGMGYRFRLHDKRLSGRPDIVLRRLNKLVFVHGCFWHIHKCKYGCVKPSTNSDFWKNKREGNKQRDKAIQRKLRLAGWSVLIVWECELQDTKRLIKRIRKFLSTNKQANKTKSADVLTPAADL